MEEELLEEVEMRVVEKAGKDCQATVGTTVVVGYTHPVVLAEVVVVEREVVVMGEESKAMLKAEVEEAAMEEDQAAVVMKEKMQVEDVGETRVVQEDRKAKVGTLEAAGCTHPMGLVAVVAVVSRVMVEREVMAVAGLEAT